MVKPLSLDLRMRIAAALAEGETVRSAAKRFGVSVASAVRMGQLHRAGGGLQHRKFGAKSPGRLRDSLAEPLRERMAIKQDWTVRDLAADLRQAGIQVSHDTVWRALRKEGLTFKKNAGGERAAAPDGGAVQDEMAGAPAPD